MGRKVVDISGRRFGRLVVIERELDGWKVRCDCGDEKVVRSQSLTRGVTRSCGCLRRETARTNQLLRPSNPNPQKSETLVGRVFGHLTVVAEAPRKLRKDGYTERCWKCECDCGLGTVVIILQCSLVTGNTLSCGCRRNGIIIRNKGLMEKPNREYILRTYQNRAKRKKQEWGLSENQFDTLTQGLCHYCGQPPSTLMNQNHSADSFIYNGIDRIDSLLGYVEGNVVSCCTMCNRMKNKYPVHEFLQHISRVLEYQELNYVVR